MKKVEFVQDFPKIELVGRKLGPFREGEEADLRPWEAYILEEEGFLEFSSNISTTYIRKILIREEKSPQLENLPSSFYQSVSLKVERLHKEGNLEELEELMDIVNSLVNFRIKKIARITISCAKPENILPEEQVFVSLLSHALSTWEDRLYRLFEKDLNKEAGTPERKVWDSIQRITGKPTNI